MKQLAKFAALALILGITIGCATMRARQPEFKQAGIDPNVLVKELEHGHGSDPPLKRHPEDLSEGVALLGIVTGFEGSLERLQAARTGSHDDFAPFRLGNGKVSSRKRTRKERVGGMRGRGSAAVPIRNFDQLDPQGLTNRTRGNIVLTRQSFQGAALIICNPFHVYFLFFQ